MSELQIAWLELVTVGGLGAILALSGVIINIVTKSKINYVRNTQKELLYNMDFQAKEECIQL